MQQSRAISRDRRPACPAVFMCAGHLYKFFSYAAAIWLLNRVGSSLRTATLHIADNFSGASTEQAGATKFTTHLIGHFANRLQH